MKPLDEVIDKLEKADLAWSNIKNNLNYEDFRDALFYLKEYRSERAMWESDRKGYLDWIEQYKEAREKHQQAVIELKKNPPLTWEELREMDGKPVWIELAYQMAWGLNDGTYIDAFGHEVVTIKVLHDLWHLDKALMGKAWQAYRKERTNA